MKIFVKYITILFGVLFFSIAVAETQNTDNHSSMLFQVDREEIIFNSSTIESATIVAVDDATDLYGLSLKLKNDAAAKFWAYNHAPAIGFTSNVS